MADTNKVDNANMTNQGTAQPTPAAPAAGGSNAPVINQGAVPNASQSPAAGTENKAEDEPKLTGKFSIVYIGGGIWTDQSGQMWCKDDHKNCISSKTFTKKELADRPDIEWMVEYGSMRKIAI